MSKKRINTENAPAAIGPYSQAIVTGNLLFTSGQLPIDPATGKLSTGSIEEQAHTVFRNLQAIAEAALANDLGGDTLPDLTFGSGIRQVRQVRMGMSINKSGGHN